MAAAQLDSSATTRKSDAMPPHPKLPLTSSLNAHGSAASPSRRLTYWCGPEQDHPRQMVATRVSAHQVRRENVPLVRMLNVVRLARVTAAHPRAA